MTEEKEQQQEELDLDTKEQGSFIEQFKLMSDQKKIAFIVFFLISFGAIIFLLFFSDNKAKEEVPIKQAPLSQVPLSEAEVYLPRMDDNSKAASNNTTMKDLMPPAAPLPPAPPPPLEALKEEMPLVLPKAPEIVAPVQVTAPQLPVPRARKDAKDLASEAKASGISMTNIMTFGSGFNMTNSDDPKKEKEVKDTNGFLGFDGGLIDGSLLQKTSAKRIAATKIDNSLAYTIVQGKVIDAVLETAINTQMQSGVIRAIVSRDVYGEQGDIILIPKGSRLVGGYNSSSESNSKALLTRVFAGWNRIITPSGMDINLSATPSTDGLGRNGIPGYLDTNLSNNLMNAFLVSVIGPYAAAKVTGISKEQITTDNNTDGKGNITSSSSSSVGAKILNDGMEQFQDIAKEQLNKIYPPGITTIYVDQGTKIDIIVQEDIIFPKESVTQSQNLP